MPQGFEVNDVVEVLFEGQYRSCIVTRVRLKDRYDVIEKESGQHYFALHESRLGVSEKRKVCKLHIGDRITRGDECGIVKKVRPDGRVDVTWKDSAQHEIAVKTENLIREDARPNLARELGAMVKCRSSDRIGKIIKLRDNDCVDIAWSDDDSIQCCLPTNTLFIRCIEDDDQPFRAGSRVLVHYTETDVYPATITKIHYPKKQQPHTSAAAVPGMHLTYLENNSKELLYDLVYDDETKEEQVPAFRLQILSPHSDLKACDDHLELSPRELSERWCHRRKANIDTVKNKFPLLRKGDSILALYNKVWIPGFVLQTTTEKDNAVQVTFTQAEENNVHFIQRRNIRQFDFSGNNEQSITSRREENIVPESLENTQNLSELRVGMVVLALPLKANSRYATKIPARILRCYVDGSIDLQYIDSDKHIVRKVNPSSLLLQAKDTTNTQSDQGLDGYCLDDQCARVNKQKDNGEFRDTSLTNHSIVDALLDKARIILRNITTGVPSGAKSTFLPLTLSHTHNEIEATDLDELLAAKGLVLSSKELSQLMKHINCIYHKKHCETNKEDRVSLNALCHFISAEDTMQTLTENTLANYLNTPAALALRQELLRCIKRYDSPPDAAACFEEIDLNKDGRIDYKEFCALTAKIGARISKQTQMQIFRLLDKDNKGYISREEFIIFVRLGFLSLTNESAPAITQVLRLGGNNAKEISNCAFNKVDTNHDGRISKEEIERALRKSGWYESFGKSIIKALDTNSDGMIDSNELETFLCRHKSSNVEERNALQKFRMGLARWFDSPCAMRQLESLSSPALGNVEKQIIADLEKLNLNLTPRDINIIAACMVSISVQNLSTLAMDIAQYFKQALKTRWTSIGNAVNIATLLNALDGLPDSKLRRLLVASNGQALTHGDWNKRVVPVFTQLGISTMLTKVVGSCIMTSSNSRADNSRALLQLIRNDPIQKLQRKQSPPIAKVKKTIQVGDSVLFLKRYTPGRILHVRANGRYDIECSDKTVEIGIRREDLRLLHEAQATSTSNPRVISTVHSSTSSAVKCAHQNREASSLTSSSSRFKSYYNHNRSPHRPHHHHYSNTVSTFVIE